MIFQDPMSSLNPRLRVSEIVGEAPLVHGLVTKPELSDYLAELLVRVGLKRVISVVIHINFQAVSDND